MKHTNKGHLRRPNSTECYLGIAMAGALIVALLGAIYNEQAVWAAGLALFALLTLQCAVVCYINTHCPRVTPESA
jgi:hypothetical protein